MRVLYFSKDYTSHDHRFLATLAQTDHQVFYLRLERGPRQVEDRPVPSKITQIPWEGGKRPFRWQDTPRLLRGLRGVIRRFKPDLIHAGPIQTCAFLAVLSGFQPILTMSWGFDLMQDADHNRWWQWVTRYVLCRTTFFTSDAEVTRDRAIAFGVPRQRTVVFPWGVDLQYFTPKRSRPPTIGRRQKAREFVLLCNRSWEPRYGVDVLARAFVKAVHQRPEIYLMLLADGSQSNLLRQILTNGGVMERVHFGGRISQTKLPRYYHMADLYISASHVDGSSVSLMEALACGLPVLVSDIPANREWVTDGLNGWLFPDGDADTLAAAIVRSYDNRKKLAGIGHAARRVAEEKAEWTKNFQKLLDAYKLAVTWHFPASKERLHRWNSQSPRKSHQKGKNNLIES